jgi:hypothetical protein
MVRLVLESYLLLIRIDLLIYFGTLNAIKTFVQSQAVRRRLSRYAVNSDTICRAMNLACVLYIKPVLCLQHSSAMAVQLRRYGRAAEMVVGVQILPPDFHAWVEVDGKILTDKPHMHEMYSILERY